MKTKKELLNLAKELGISKYILDKIIEKHLNINRSQVFLLDSISKENFNNIQNDLYKISKKEPFEYIIGKADFYNLEFIISPDVLIPRNDTEIMVDKVLEIKNLSLYNLIDVGTGSGAIGLTLCKNTQLQNIILSDISEQALTIAKKNQVNNNISQTIIFQKSDLLTYFIKNSESFQFLKDTPLVLTANLPYIRNCDIANMSPETLKFEPHLALFGGKKTGFELYKILINQIFDISYIYNIKEIILFIEIGFDQKEIAVQFLESLSLQYKIFKDNNNIDRTIKIFFDF